MFSKVLIANRGEIAVRIARACAELGVGSVAVHSDPDRDALHVRVASEAVSLGGVSAAESYLDVDKILAAAKATGAEGIHPGYGFLAENAGFAEAVVAAGLVFIGPSGEAIRVMGEKVSGRTIATRAGVPGVPGSEGAVESADQVRTFGESHGYPLLIKASFGGGGRGMRTVGGPEEVDDGFASAQREAQAAFGRAEVYVERYLAQARHIEVQVFADTHGNAVWLGDRDCSVQRRHQKLVEEAPASGLSPQLREAMGAAAMRLVKAVDYVGAGTVEFLVEGEQFFYLEMNTRIQVEHPVTELVLGMDLVTEQLRVAAGEPLSVTTSGPTPRGHALECRINAESVAAGRFLPSPGTITALRAPVRAGVRLDAGYEAGDEVLPYYDSLVGKLLVWAPTREHARRRMLAALDDLVLEGIRTTVPAARLVLEHPDFAAGSVSTRWLESLDLRTLLPAAPPAAFAGEIDAAPESEDEDERQVVWVGARRYLVPLPGRVETAGPAAPSRGRSGAAISPRFGARRGAGAGPAASGTVTSVMQGTVVKVLVQPDQQVEAGELIFVLEAMKMENPVTAPFAGSVASVSVTAGDVVAAGAVLAVIEPPAEPGPGSV